MSRPIEVSTAILDEKLPGNWLGGLSKEMLARVVAGRPINIKDFDISVKDFLRNIFNCLICLPEKVARQISFGAGVGMANDKLRVALGAKAYGTRKAVGEWRDDIPSLKFGQEYVDLLLQKIEDCRTPREVMQAVEKLPQDILNRVEKNIFPE